jgi:hypothetical protein
MTPGTTASTPALAARLQAGLVLVLLAAGSLALWAAVPAGTVWALSKVTTSAEATFGAAIVCVPLAMIGFAALLAWLNELHVRITRTYAPPRSHWRGGGEEARGRGPLEPLLLASLLIAAACAAAWFFLLAENPLLW